MTEKDCDSCKGHFCELDQEPCKSCEYTRGAWNNWQPIEATTQ